MRDPARLVHSDVSIAEHTMITGKQFGHDGSQPGPREAAAVDIESAKYMAKSAFRVR